jgi:hypothetical protein
MTSLKTILVPALAGTAVFAFVGCKSDGHTGHNHGMAANPYPLNKCIVSDEAFDHGKPVVFVYQDQEIKLCCKDCRKDFDIAPAKYLTKLAAAK